MGKIIASDSFLEETHFTKDQIGSLQAAFFFTYALFQVPAGWASDRFGARRMLTGYILAWSLLTILTGLSRNFFEMRAARLAFGVAQSGAYPTSGGLIRNWFPVLGRGKVSGLVTFGGRVGGTLAPFLTAILMLQLSSWRYVLYIYGALGLVIAAAYWIFVRDRPADCHYCNEAEKEFIGIREPEPRPQLSEVPGMLWSFASSPSLWCNAGSQLMVNIGWAFLINWLPTYLKEAQKVDGIAGAGMVTLVLSAGVPGQLLGGILADLSIRHIGLRWGRCLPVTGACIIAGLAYLACPYAKSTWGIVGLCMIVSLMTDVCNPSTWAFMQDVGGRNTSSAAGWGNMWGNFGAMLNARMIPFALASAGSTLEGSQAAGWRIVFLTCAAAFFLSAILALGMNPTKRLSEQKKIVS